MKYAAFGTQLQMGDGGTPTETFATIQGLSKLGGPQLTLDEIDVTSHDSPGGYEEVVMTILRSGLVAVTIMYDPPAATHNKTTGLLKKYQSRTKTNFKLILPDIGLSTWTFAGYVKDFGMTNDTTAAMEAAVNIKVTGAVVPV